jgi:hypothetical protein
MAALESTFSPPASSSVHGERPGITPSRSALVYTAIVPWAIDFNWPETTATGQLRNLGAIRVLAARPARIEYSVEIESEARVRAAGGSGVVVSLHLCPGGARPVISAEALIERPASDDPLLLAMMGQHPLDWMRTLVHGVGSAAWTAMARQAQVCPYQLDRLMELWRGLSRGAEHALWRCAETQPAFAELKEWAGSLSKGVSPAEIGSRVRSRLEADWHWASSPAAEWLEASAGLPLCMVDAPAAAYRLREAARLFTSLLEQGLTFELLGMLKEMAGLSMARQRMAFWSAAQLQEKQHRRDVLERVCQSIYAEAQQALSDVAAVGLGKMMEGASGWPLAEARFNMLAPGCSQRVRAALSGDLNAFHSPASGVCSMPSTFGLSMARPLSISVSLPLVSHQRALRMIAELDRGDIAALPGGRIEVRPKLAQRHPLSVCAQSVLERTALAPLLAASPEPGAAEEDMACEERFTAGGLPALFAARLLEWYGLPSSLTERAESVALRLSITGGWTQIWHELPHSRDESFQSVFAAVSGSIQMSMRRWLPHLTLKRLEIYSDPSEALPAMAYAGSAPFCGKSEDAFTRPRRSAAAVRAALYSGASDFRETLNIVHGELKKLGFRHCRNFDPSNWRAMLVAIYLQRQPFCRFLEADALCMEEVLHLSDTARELRGLTGMPKSTSRMLLKSMESLRTGLGRRFHALLAERGSELLPAVLCIEATAAACRAMGAEARVAATLIIQRQNGVEICHNGAALGRC